MIKIHLKIVILFLQQKISKLRYNKAMIYALLGSDILMAVFFFWRYPFLPSQIPLFYTHSAGEEQLGEWWMIFTLPILLNFFILFNTLFYARIFNDSVFVKKMFHYLNLFLILIFTFAFLKIILLVT